MTDALDTLEKRRIPWYRTRLDRALLADLNRRSDLLGLLQTLGYLGTLAATGALAWWTTLTQPWYWWIPALYLHGACYAFLINGFHELVHSSVFRTQPLNTFFLYVFSFLGMHSPIHFWASHQEHHKYTLHPPEDGEVVLPVRLTLKAFLKGGFVVPLGPWHRFKGLIRRGFFGHLNPGWDQVLFPPENVEGRRKLFLWDRVLVVGHLTLIAGSLWLGWWQLPVLVTLANFYGGLLQILCNNTQHVGLTDDVADFRLCTRTISLNPVVQFLYWHMNYHVEHHMFAAVPCYRLGRLHRAIRHDLPETRGLVGAWREIVAIHKRQAVEPAYEHTPALPTTATPSPALAAG